MQPDRKTITLETKYFERFLDIPGFYIKDKSENHIILKEMIQKMKTEEYVWILASLIGSLYFIFIDFQAIIASILFILFSIFTFVILLYPKRVKNQYLKIDFVTQTIEYRIGLNKNINQFNIDSHTTITCQIDEYGHDFHTTYSATFYHNCSGQTSNIFFQCDSNNKKNCLKFTKGFIRYLTSLSSLKQIGIIDKTYSK